MYTRSIKTLRVWFGAGRKRRKRKKQKLGERFELPWGRSAGDCLTGLGYPSVCLKIMMFILGFCWLNIVFF
jgi:hypothetical protein